MFFVTANFCCNVRDHIVYSQFIYVFRYYLNVCTCFNFFIYTIHSRYVNLVVRTFHTSREVVLVPAYSRFAYSCFAYSLFAYFRPKSGVSPTLKIVIFGHQSDVGVDFHQCLSQGLMPTLVESGHRLHWTKISEDGQGEDRLITFAMSSLISYYCSAFCSAFIFKTVQRTVRKVFFNPLTTNDEYSRH